MSASGNITIEVPTTKKKIPRKRKRLADVLSEDTNEALNLESTKTKEKKQEDSKYQTRRFCLTDHTWDETRRKTWLDQCGPKGDCKLSFIQFSLEKCPKTLKLHLQMYFELWMKMTWGGVFKWLADIGITVGYLVACRGTQKQNLIYTSKVASHEEGPWRAGTPMQQGAQLSELKEAIDTNPEINDFQLMQVDFANMIKSKKSIGEYRHLKQNSLLLDPYPIKLPDDSVLNQPSVNNKKCNYWIVAPSDYGKTKWIENTFEDKRVYKVEKGNYPFDGYDGEPVLIFNDWEPCFDLLRQASDCYKTRTQCYGNQRYGFKYWPKRQRRTIIVLRYKLPKYKDNVAFINRFNILDLTPGLPPAAPAGSHLQSNVFLGVGPIVCAAQSVSCLSAVVPGDMGLNRINHRDPISKSNGLERGRRGPTAVLPPLDPVKTDDPARVKLRPNWYPNWHLGKQHYAWNNDSELSRHHLEFCMNSEKKIEQDIIDSNEWI